MGNCINGKYVGNHDKNVNPIPWAEGLIFVVFQYFHYRELLGQFDAMWDRGSLVAIDKTERER